MGVQADSVPQNAALGNVVSTGGDMCAPAFLQNLQL